MKHYADIILKDMFVNGREAIILSNRQIDPLNIHLQYDYLVKSILQTEESLVTNIRLFNKISDELLRPYRFNDFNIESLIQYPLEFSINTFYDHNNSNKMDDAAILSITNRLKKCVSKENNFSLSDVSYVLANIYNNQFANIPEYLDISLFKNDIDTLKRIQKNKQFKASDVYLTKQGKNRLKIILNEFGVREKHSKYLDKALLEFDNDIHYSAMILSIQIK